jgi:hypothetical protein
MAIKTQNKNNSKDVYKATSSYKTFMTGNGLLTKEQHKDLLGGKKTNLKGVPEKQLQYLLTNNLIEGE